MTFTPARFLMLAAIPALALAGCNKSGDTGAGAGPVPTSAAALPKVTAAAGKAWSDVVEVTPDGGYRMGNPDAPIKLVEYGSLSCPHCAHLAEEGFNPLVNDYVGSGRVSYEYRSFAIHAVDVPLTMLAQCADKGAFFALVDQLYANQPALLDRAQKGEAAANAAAKLPDNQRFIAISDAMGFTDFFAQRGVPKPQAEKCLAENKTATEIATRAQTWGNKGVDSTPTLFINNRKIEGATWAEVKTALQNAGAR
ncbi:thioredoxin domain-containing protein [Novosphingobium sp.]|uniref:DsbA family protein n=1 Tax=Novosphingobium sp. TaxID=1874826 RepID=UPI0025FD499D|nr:thioredoxin domain-containing protein [Novosphingobium sp.]